MADITYRELVELLHAKDYIKTICMADEYLLTCPFHYHVQLIRAEALYHLGRYGRALEDINVIIKNRPSAHAYHMRGLIYMKLSEYDLAMKDIEAAIYIDQKYAPAYNSRSLIHYKKGAYSKATEDAKYAQNIFSLSI